MMFLSKLPAVDGWNITGKGCRAGNIKKPDGVHTPSGKQKCVFLSLNLLAFIPVTDSIPLRNLNLLCRFGPCFILLGKDYMKDPIGVFCGDLIRIDYIFGDTETALE